MKNLVLSLLSILLMVNVCTAQESGSELLKNDKFKHICAGVVISEVTYVGSNLIWKDPGVSFRMSIAINVSVSTYKEMYDSMNGGDWSFKDQGFTIASGLIVSGINYAAQKWLFNLKENKYKRRNNIDDPFLSVKGL